MGSTMNSRYWTCPSCCLQFDWADRANSPADHDSRECAARGKPKRDSLSMARAARARRIEALRLLLASPMPDAGDAGRRAQMRRELDRLLAVAARAAKNKP